MELPERCRFGLYCTGMANPHLTRLNETELNRRFRVLRGLPRITVFDVETAATLADEDASERQLIGEHETEPDRPDMAPELL